MSCRNAWVRILQQAKPFEVSSVDVSLDAAKRIVTGTTSNVTTMELEPLMALPAAGTPADITITLDGQSIAASLKTDTPYLRLRCEQGSKDKAAWRLDPACGDGSPVDIHNGEFIGSMSRYQGDDIVVQFVYPRVGSGTWIKR